jgi:hypothetical protein
LGELAKIAAHPKELGRSGAGGSGSSAEMTFPFWVRKETTSMGSLVGSNNAILVNKCKSLRNLTVSLQVTEDLITLGNHGFSLQLNCYPQPTPTVNGKPLKWAQYVIAVQGNSVVWGIQYFSAVKGFGFNGNGNYSVPFASATSNQVPKGSVMKIALKTDPSGNVTSATFIIIDPKGTVSSYKYPSPGNVLPLCALYGFEVNLVGPPSTSVPGSGTTTFTQGAGILTYSVSSGKLAVQTTNTCKIAVTTKSGFKVIKGGVQGGTSEQSNAPYGNIKPASGRTVRQSVGPPSYTNPPLTPTTYIPIPNIAFHTTITGPVALNNFNEQAILRLANLPGATQAPTGPRTNEFPIIPGKYVVFGRVVLVNLDHGGDPQNASVMLITDNANVLDRVDTRIAGYNQMQGGGSSPPPVNLSITGSLSISLQGTLDTLKLKSNTVYLQASTYQGQAVQASLIAISIDDILKQTGTQNKPTWKSTDAAKTSGSIF